MIFGVWCFGPRSPRSLVCVVAMSAVVMLPAECEATSTHSIDGTGITSPFQAPSGTARTLQLEQEQSQQLE